LEKVDVGLRESDDARILGHQVSTEFMPRGVIVFYGQTIDMLRPDAKRRVVTFRKRVPDGIIQSRVEWRGGDGVDARAVTGAGSVGCRASRKKVCQASLRQAALGHPLGSAVSGGASRVRESGSSRMDRVDAEEIVDTEESSESAFEGEETVGPYPTGER
jgi:hypothetical protein